MENFNLDYFFGEPTYMRAVELYETVHKDIFTVKDLSIGYRDVHLWDVAGLLGDRREKESSWRKFNFMDYLWMQIIDELKLFGTSNDVIKGVKENIHEIIPFTLLMEIAEANMEKIEKTADKESLSEFKAFLKSKDRSSVDDNEGVSLLLLLMIECITTKAPVSIIIFGNGDFFLWNENKKIYSKEEIEKLSYETYITISMTKIIRKFLYNAHSSFILPKLDILKETELKLLDIIHSGEYETITINFKNKKMKTLQLVKEQDVKRKVVDVLALNGYQDIVIKSHNGMITKIQNTVKVRLD